MAADMSGICELDVPGTTGDDVETSPGSTSLAAGTRSTSSKVSPSVAKRSVDESAMVAPGAACREPQATGQPRRGRSAVTRAGHVDILVLLHGYLPTTNADGQALTQVPVSGGGS
jgi:hypothetical protein